MASNDAELEALDQILLTRNFKPEEAAKDIQAEIDALDLLIAQRQQPGVIETAATGTMNAIGEIGEFVDKYTGAPTRAALGQVALGEYSKAIPAFTEQFGEPTAQAPTGKEIAQVMGFSANPIVQSQSPVEGAQGRIINQPGTNQPMMRQEVSPAGVVGLGIDIVADPLNFIPIAGAAKLAGKTGKFAAKTTSQIALKGSVAAEKFLTGTAAIEKTADTTKKYVESVSNAISRQFKPTIAADAEKFADIAFRNGIDPKMLPETVEFGPSSTIARKAKGIAEGPAGDNITKRFEQAQGAVEDAIERRIQAHGGKAVSPAEAGSALVEAHNRGVKSFFDQDMITHDKIIQSNPGMVLTQDGLKSVVSKVQGMRNKAAGLARRGTPAQVAEAKSFLSGYVDIVQRSLDKNGNLSYKRAAELMRNIGPEAFAKPMPGVKPSPFQDELKDLYFKVREAAYNSSAHVAGPEVAEQLVTNNVIISDFLKDKGRVAKLFEGNHAPEKLFQRLADSGDTEQLKALQTIVSPDDYAKFKSAYVNNLIVRGADGAPMYKSTIKKINKRFDQIKEVVGDEEVKELVDLLQLGDRIGEPILSKSGTGQSILFKPKEWVSNILAGGTDELTLEALKKRARAKSAEAAPVKLTLLQGGKPQAKSVKITPDHAKELLNQIPLLQSRPRQLLKVGQVKSTQETNKEIERRKRATAGE